MKAQELIEFRAGKEARSPRLDTVLMIEKAVYEGRSDKTITEIWKTLPKKVMWTTFTTVLRYLEYSGKIIIERDKTIAWIWAPKAIEAMKAKGLVVK